MAEEEAAVRKAEIGEADVGVEGEGDSQEPESTSTLCIPLRYSIVTRPFTSEPAGQRVLFDALPDGPSLWRDYDLRDEDKLFSVVEGREICDSLPTMRKVVAGIKREFGPKAARLNEERVLENVITVTLAGSVDDVNRNRAEILRNYYSVERREIVIDQALAYDNPADPPKINSALCLKLSEIASHCMVAISLTDYADKLPGQAATASSAAAAAVAAGADSTYRIYIYGDQDAVSYAHLRVVLLLDHLTGKFVDSIDLDLSLHPLVCGPAKCNIFNIEAQTGAKIHFPNGLAEIFSSQEAELSATDSTDTNDDDNTDIHDRDDDENSTTKTLYRKVPARNLNKIFISGPEANVTLAKAMLKEVIRRTKPIVKDCVVSFAKIELLLLRQQRDIRRLMDDYGVFVQLPYLGAARSLVRLQGVTALSVEKAISKLMLLTTDIYSANYWIHTGQSEGSILKQPEIDTNLEFLDKISFASGATIRCLDNTSFDITGDRAGTKRAIGMIKALPLWMDYLHQVRFRIELSIEQREFIAGRKNGKISRIMNNSNVWIRFLPFNEYNFYLSLIGDDYSAVIAGIRLLEDELPTEYSFYIPETYHKQVIGAGGHTIQTIMRKYNVFVKFSNEYDALPNGFGHVRPDNVLIRCPAKNAKNIPAAKQELLDTVRERARDHYNTFIRIPRSHRRILLSERCGFIHEVESKTNTVILFPEVEPTNDKSDLIEIRGLGNTSEDASRMVKAVLPDDYVFKLAYNSRFDETISEHNPDFYANIIVPFRIALSIETQVYSRPLEDDDGNRYHRIVLSFSQEHGVGLEDVIQALTSYLRDRGVDIIDRGELRTDPIEPGSAASQSHKRKVPQMFMKGPGAARGGPGPGVATSAGGPGGGGVAAIAAGAFEGELPPPISRAPFDPPRFVDDRGRERGRDRGRDHDRDVPGSPRSGYPSSRYPPPIATSRDYYRKDIQAPPLGPPGPGPRGRSPRSPRSPSRNRYQRPSSQPLDYDSYGQSRQGYYRGREGSREAGREGREGPREGPRDGPREGSRDGPYGQGNWDERDREYARTRPGYRNGNSRYEYRERYY